MKFAISCPAPKNAAGRPRAPLIRQGSRLKRILKISLRPEGDAYVP